MNQFLRKQISKWRKFVDLFVRDDAGTAALLTAPRQYSKFLQTTEPVSVARRSKPVARPALVTPPQPDLALPQVQPIATQPTIWPEGNDAVEYQFAKRAMDLLGALALLLVLSPILLTVLVVLMITTRGKPLFSQERVGLCGRRFRMYKFRTMRLDADKLQHLVQNEKDGPIFKNRHDPRITRLGRWLRKTSIDELPQLANVLLGDMSLVGPRPPVPKEVAKYKAWQRRRLSVKPGLTCKWQVSGRSEVGFEDWVRMDLWYVRHQNLWIDLTLLVRTPLTVIMCKGAY